MPIPASCKRIVLINPTRFLGNVLIAGGLIQDFSRFCTRRNIELLIVIDELYAALLTPCLPDARILSYPRGRISKANLLSKAQLYLGCLKSIRQFDADIAFNIEEDSVSHRLTQLSGARINIGCSTRRHRSGYQHVVPVDYRTRPIQQRHRWYSFQQVFMYLGLGETTPGYLQLNISAYQHTPPPMLDTVLRSAAPIALLHPGASVSCKQWPLTNFAFVAANLIESGFQVVLIGSGKDALAIAGLMTHIPKHLHKNIVNTCDTLTLTQLASMMSQAQVMLGNDSGPFHLAAATGIKGVVIFGPTDKHLWAPLSAQCKLLQSQNTPPCDPLCTKTGCLHEQRCLKAVSPQAVLRALHLLQESNAPGHFPA